MHPVAAPGVFVQSMKMNRKEHNNYYGHCILEIEHGVFTLLVLWWHGKGSSDILQMSCCPTNVMYTLQFHNRVALSFVILRFASEEADLQYIIPSKTYNYRLLQRIVSGGDRLLWGTVYFVTGCASSHTMRLPQLDTKTSVSISP